MTSHFLNENVVNATPSPIRAFNDSISHIDNLLAFTLGEPDFATPDAVKGAAILAIQADHSHYTHSRGLLELRQAISRYLKRHYQLDYSADDEIIVTVGATGGLFSSLMALLNPGDQVLCPAPNYPNYRIQTELAGGEFHTIDVSESQFKLTPSQLEEALVAYPRTKVLMMNHPCNPTGVSYTEDELVALAKVIDQHDIFVISDEIYAELSYHNPHVSLAKLLPEKTVLINGASKSHAMTGWRMAFTAGPKYITDQIFKVAQASVNTPATAMQYASIVAYDQCDADIQTMADAYLKRRNYLTDQLSALEFDYINPDGAFYLFVKVPNWYQGDDVAFCRQLAEEVKIGVTPGSAFGEPGRGYFRISYAASQEQLEELVARLSSFKQQYK